MDYRDHSSRPALTAIWQRKLMVVFAALLLSAIAVVAIFSVPRLYRAQTSMLLVFHEEYTGLSANGRPENAIRVGLAEAIGSEMQILSSRELKAQLVEKLGPDGLFPRLSGPPGLASRMWIALTGRPLNATAVKAQLFGLLARLGVDVEGVRNAMAPPLGPEDAAIERLTENLNIRRVEGSNIITVQYRHESPQVAAMTLNTLVDLFRKRREEVFANLDHRPLEVESAEALQALRNVEGRMDGVMRGFGGIGVDEQRRLYTQQRFQLTQQLADPRTVLTQDIRRELQSRLAHIDGQLQALGRADRELQRLRPEYDVAVKSYDAARSTLGSARLISILSRDAQPTIRVIDPATPPAKPYGLEPGLLLGLSVAVSLLASMLLAVAMGPKRTAAKIALPMVREIERALNPPVLAIVDCRPDVED